MHIYSYIYIRILNPFITGIFSVKCIVILWIAHQYYTVLAYVINHTHNDTRSVHPCEKLTELS